MPAERERIGTMLRALLDRAETTGGFSGDNNWEPLVVIDAITGGFGITWNTPVGDPLVIGLGAKASNVGGEPINLAVLAKLLRIQAGGPADHALGDVEFEGTFPVPDFLASGSLEGGVTATQNPVEVSVGLKATTTPPPAEDSRTLSYQTPDGPSPEILGWDASRLAVYVLKAFVAQRAATASRSSSGCSSTCSRCSAMTRPKSSTPSRSSTTWGSRPTSRNGARACCRARTRAVRSRSCGTCGRC